MSRVEYNVEQVLQRLGLSAKKKGRSWWLLCLNPDHDDRHPTNFHIHDEPGSTKNGFFKCFSCGVGGTLEDLVVLVHGFQGDEHAKRDAARRWLAGSAVEQKLPTSVAVQVVGGFRKFALPSEASFGPLDEWVTPARDFVVSRGITAWQVVRWGLGYIVDGPLGGRLLIPYRSARGETLGYTARTFIQKGKVAKRYKEPDPWEAANPNVMFGEQHWWASGTPQLGQEDVYVTEGALNALAVERSLANGDIPESCWTPHIAATAGSFFKPAHAAKLAMFRRVVVLSDPDGAGDKIAEEMRVGFARHCEVVRVRLPPKEDANDVERRGALAGMIAEALAAAPSLR